MDDADAGGQPVADERSAGELVKAVAGCGAAEGTRQLTGIWPGEADQQPEKEA